MASMCGERLNNLRNDFTVLKMTKQFDKRQIYVGNDVYLWEMVLVFEKHLKYVRNDVDLWEMDQICGEMA